MAKIKKTDEYYIIDTKNDGQYKADLEPKQVGDAYFFNCFKRNLAKAGTSPKWVFLKERELFPVAEVTKMRKMRFLSSDSK